MENYYTTTLQHITDVGISHHDGVDSTSRIEKQYKRLGINPAVVSAGHSPLHVAFTACTDLSPQAIDNVAILLKKLGIDTPKLPPIALNSAPRNSSKTYENGQEEHIYRVKSEGFETFLIYGLEVLRWVLEFRGRAGAVVEKILSISNVIPDTSNGSQFRSGEYLPLVQFLESKGLLDSLSERENVELKQLPPTFFDKEKEVVVAPPDEYLNGRLIIDTKLLHKVLAQNKIRIPEITNQTLTVKKSLTEVTPGELFVWLSSNYFPNKALGVINIGTRWQPGTTSTTDIKTIELSQKLSRCVGKCYEVQI